MSISFYHISPLFLLLLGMGTQHAGDATMHKWIIEDQSSLQVEGSSNITDFSCDVAQYPAADTLLVQEDIANKRFVFQNSTLEVAVKSFDCHQRFITTDFRKTLSAKSNILKIRFLTMEHFVLSPAPQVVRGWVDLEVGGVQKRVLIQYTVRQTGPQQLEVTGQQGLKFSDFKLTPPRKLAGFVRIEEDIKVSFRLYFKVA